MQAFGSPDAYAPAPNPIAGSFAPASSQRSGFQLPGFSEFIGGVTQLAGAALPIIANANQQSIAAAQIRANQTVQLAQQGFTTGNAQVAPGIQNLWGRVPVGGSSLGLSSGTMALVVIGGLVLLLGKR